MNPRVYKEEGFRLLARIVQRYAQEGLYVVLNMHAVPGGQNQDWHSDSGVHKALFWQHKHFQDRTVHLWITLAKRYLSNVHVRVMPLPSQDCSNDRCRLPATIRSTSLLTQITPISLHSTSKSRKPFDKWTQTIFYSSTATPMQWTLLGLQRSFQIACTLCMTTLQWAFHLVSPLRVDQNRRRSSAPLSNEK